MDDYQEGDHIAIIPENNPELVLRVASLINEQDLGRTVTATATATAAATANTNANADDEQVQVSPRGTGHLPLGIRVKISNLLGRHIDLLYRLRKYNNCRFC